MKILATFLLSSFFVFLPAKGVAPLYAQTSSLSWDLAHDCGFPPAMKTFTVDLNGRVEPAIVEILEDKQNCLNNNLMQLHTSVEELHTQMGWNADSNLGFRNDIHDLQDKLKQTELDLHTAVTKIETLEDRLRTAEETLQVKAQRMDAPRPASNPKATVSKPKTASQWDAQGNPIVQPLGVRKPAAPVNKPSPKVKEGAH
jgi:hypothetical protein